MQNASLNRDKAFAWRCLFRGVGLLALP